MLYMAATIADGHSDKHGAKQRSFQGIALMWTAYLMSRQDSAGPIRPHDVAHMMVLLKQQRAEWGTALPDHFVDAAGYSAIAGELLLS